MLNGTLQILIFFALVLAVTVPVGAYMYRVFEGEMRWLHWFERPLYRLLGVREDDDQPWTHYAASLMAFSVVGLLITYVLLRAQGHLPMNDGHLGGPQMPRTSRSTPPRRSRPTRTGRAIRPSWRRATSRTWSRSSTTG